MITNGRTARTFAQSIASQAIALQDALTALDFEEASSLLDDIEMDRERLQAYVNGKLEAAEEVKK